VASRGGVSGRGQVRGQAGDVVTPERQGMGYGTRPHDWELDELESMKTLYLAVSLVYVTQPIVADQHVPSRRAVLGPAHAAPHDSGIK
jgi:hypothetical protein